MKYKCFKSRSGVFFRDTYYHLDTILERAAKKELVVTLDVSGSMDDQMFRTLDELFVVEKE